MLQRESKPYFVMRSSCVSGPFCFHRFYPASNLIVSAHCPCAVCIVLVLRNWVANGFDNLITGLITLRCMGWAVTAMCRYYLCELSLGSFFLAMCLCCCRSFFYQN